MGYHLDQVKYGNTILNPKVSLHDGHVSSDGGEILWYGEPYVQSGTITGTSSFGSQRTSPVLQVLSLLVKRQTCTCETKSSFLKR